MSDGDLRPRADDPNRRRREAGSGHGARGGEDLPRARNREQEEWEYGDWVVPGGPIEEEPDDDEVLRTDPRPDERKDEARPGADPPPVGEDAPPLGRRLSKREAAPPGWLPSKASFTPEELLACALAALAAFVAAAGGIVLVDGLLPIPDQIARNSVPVALALGAWVGFYVLLRLRIVRLARRKHLRGEK